MKIINQNKKSKILATATASLMLLANGGLVLANATKNALDGMVFANYTPTSVNVSNGDFSNPTSGSLPYTPTNWEVQNKSGDVTCGVIDLGSSFEDKQDETYNLTFKPNTTVLNDKQVLMINSADTNSSCGYKSSSFNLNAGSHYVITFKAYTENTAAHSAFGSAILSGDDSEVVANSILLINTSDNTSSNWKEYSIFVETDQINSKNLNLELWLGQKNGNGSNGAIFFDDVSVMCYDHDDYTTKLLGRNSSTSMVVNFNTNYVDNFMQNASFENDLAGWKLIDESSSTSSAVCKTGVANVGSGYDATVTGIESNPTNANIYGNNKALFINNIDKGNVGYQSSHFTIKQNRLYKLSFLAKTGELDGSATVNLVERNPYTNEFLSDGTTKNPNYYANSSYTASTFSISDISTNEYTNDKTNDWKYYTFYITGSPYLDSEVCLEIWLGTKDAQASGYAFFDHFTLQQLNSKDFGTGNTEGTKANLNKATASTDFANCAFNNVVLASPTDTAPFTPADWSLTQTNKSALNGVVNTSTTVANVPAINPISTKYPNNNVLMIGNTADNYQKYTSNSVTLEADKYVKIETTVLTYGLNKASAGLRLVSNGEVIGEILNITDTTWTTYAFVIKTGYESKSVTLELSLGETAQGTGYAFFDNVVMTKDLTAEDFAQDTINTKKINLASYDFSNISNQATNGKYQSFDFVATNNSQTNQNYLTTGIIDTAKFGQVGGCEDSNYPNPSHPENSNSYVLMIESSADTHYSYTTKTKSTLTADNYYKIDVVVKTSAMYQNDEESKVLIDDSNDKYHPCGASIVIDGIDAKFAGIDTNGQWKTYTVYVNCTSTTDINITLALGSEKALTSGAAYFSSATISKIDQEAYSDGVAVLEDETPDNIMAIGSTDVEPEEDAEPENQVNFDWLIVPSLITALAILIAVVGTIVRKTRKPKKKVVLKSYSKENVKKINQKHKKSVKDVNKELSKLAKQQNQLATQINELKAAGNTKQAGELRLQYNENNKKIEKLEANKAQLNKEHNEQIKSIKAEKDADNKLSK